MIVFRTYNVIIPKFKIEELVDGRLRAVRNTFGRGDFQEDDYLVGIAVKNATEVRETFEELLKMGLSFDNKSGSSDDFTVMAKEGIWWDVDWLISNMEGCWFIADVEAPVS